MSCLSDCRSNRTSSDAGQFPFHFKIFSIAAGGLPFLLHRTSCLLRCSKEMSRKFDAIEIILPQFTRSRIWKRRLTMRHMSDAERTRLRQSLVGNFLLLLFGLGVLGFLVAIDRADWFTLRPVSGTSVALSHAATSAHGGDSAKQ
jgi:hypothetical protein